MPANTIYWQLMHLRNLWY